MRHHDPHRPRNLPRMHLSAGGHHLHAWVARSAEEHALGLMHRQQLGDGEGMLFVWDVPERKSFWMKDTPLPLSVAFLEEDGTIVRLADMEPHSLEGHASGRPVRFVLEVNQGWFEDKGIAPGMRLDGPCFATTTGS
ncbi:DUF192 domain-containing protein [Ramlibacter sp. XY19]|uniref:DUF192 domain-containing protein n=1 Tax=Ramlibacter paludis TaxID=2908000 RepID=UPI0023D9A622|nr:DUF192 domain-containing protein [Ramlibacter paludis]MCG2591548.1 DUF192 domain-containing protein [Ramlibacter paludis]